ncbi:MAG TPA: putative lipid II flippase FtsW [Conexibacter sp.]|nr:putative lipid II flippase FtsW [Conexibacter sp.]
MSRRAAQAPRAGRSAGRARTAAPRPVEQRVLLTAALILLAFGAVMVYSASSARNLLQGHGDGTQFLVRYVAFGSVGLVVMHVLSRRGVALMRQFTPLLLIGSFGLLLLVLIPGIGISVNGARRWIGPGTLSFQPSELMKLALILYVAQFLANHPRRIQTFKGMVSPIVVVTGAAAMLVAAEPDLGTALVISMSVAALLVAAGVPLKYLGYLAVGGVVLIGMLVLVQPYQQARLTAFLDPWASASTSGFQSVQGQIALGSGGLLGVGLGQSVQKVFYLPEAHTDFILAVIGEELGVVGVSTVIALFGLIAWSGLRIARAATAPYAKLLATGLTSLILCQATLNIFVVLGIAPLTGVPLPFISYGPTNLMVILASVGLLLNVAEGNRAGLRLVEPSSRRTAPPDRDGGAADRDRRRRDGGPRRAGAGGRRRAAG